jgi:hypothetical protein
MRRKPGFRLIALLIGLLAVQDVPVLSAQAALPAPEQLDQLLAPIALYPRNHPFGGCWQSSGIGRDKNRSNLNCRRKQIACRRRLC